MPSLASSSDRPDFGTARATYKPVVRKLRCAVYTRKSTEEGLEMEFNSLNAQREACEAYMASKKAEGWLLVADRYDDGGFSGGNLERPALKRLMADIEARRADVVVVYKTDRLSRSLMDFAKLVEVFDRNAVRTWRTARRQIDTISEADVRDTIEQLDPLWDELFPAEQTRIVQLLVERVDVQEDAVEIRFRVDGLASLAEDFKGQKAA
jgi:hypothetical protein